MEKSKGGIHVNKVSESTKKTFKTRVISAVIGIAVIIPALFLGDWAFFFLIIVALGIGVIELVRCAKKKYSIWLYIVTFIVCLALVIWPLIGALVNRGSIAWDTGHIYSGYDRIYVSFITMIIGIFALFYIIMWDEHFTVRDACFIFALGFLMAMGFQSILFLRNFPTSSTGVFQYLSDGTQGFYNVDNTLGSMFLVVYLLIATFGTDTGAYMFGILFGKNKINPRISPNKTWAGFWGGLFFSSALSMGFAFIMAACNNPIMPFRFYNGALRSIFDLSHWYNIVILSIIIPPFATLGDFVFSAIKRYYDIKDFGRLLPGHGGILDRLDSIFFSSLIMALYVVVAFAIDAGTFSILLI